MLRRTKRTQPQGRTEHTRPKGYRKRHGVLKANGTKIVGTGVLDGPLQMVRITENFVKWTVEDAGPYNEEKRITRTRRGGACSSRSNAHRKRYLVQGMSGCRERR